MGRVDGGRRRRVEEGVKQKGVEIKDEKEQQEKIEEIETERHSCEDVAESRDAERNRRWWPYSKSVCCDLDKSDQPPFSIVPVPIRTHTPLASIPFHMVTFSFFVLVCTDGLTPTRTPPYPLTSSPAPPSPSPPAGGPCF